MFGNRRTCIPDLEVSAAAAAEARTADRGPVKVLDLIEPK